MAFVEDLSVFFSTAEFADSATIALPADAAGLAIAGIFDAAYQALDVGASMESSGPVFLVPEATLPTVVLDALRAGDPVALDVRGCTYTVVESLPDGTGVSVLRLRK